MKIKLQVGTWRATFVAHNGDAAEMVVYAGRFFDPADPTIHAYQIKLAWLYVTVWWVGEPVTHDALSGREG